MNRFSQTPQHTLNTKSHTLLPAKDMALMILIVATPYAGIIRVRFKGYNLSPFQLQIKALSSLAASSASRRTP